jgi:hypothetical protein
MPATEINIFLDEAVAEVLETMCFMSVIEPLEGEPDAGLEWVSATLNVTGGSSGTFGVCAPLPDARAMAANFLGEDASEIDDARTFDTLCEISNMICGGFLGRLGSDRVYDLSHPMAQPALVLPPEGAMMEGVQLDEGILYVWTDLGARP